MGVDDHRDARTARAAVRTNLLLGHPDDARALVEAGRMVERYPGTHLFRQGEPPDACFVVTDGEVELYRRSGVGRAVVGRFGRGSALGDIAAFQGRPYLSSARAVGRVLAIEIRTGDLVTLLRARPNLAMRWLVNGLTQLEDTQRRLVRLLHPSVVGRVAGLLLDERDEFDEVVLSQSSIAELLGVSRQSVNEAIGDLRDSGSIATGYRRISVLDPSALALASTT